MIRGRGSAARAGCLVGIADDIAAHLDATDANAALTDRDLSDQLLGRGVETALQLIDDRVSSMG